MPGKEGRPGESHKVLEDGGLMGESVWKIGDLTRENWGFNQGKLGI